MFARLLSLFTECHPESNQNKDNDSDDETENLAELITMTGLEKKSTQVVIGLNSLDIHLNREKLINLLIQNFKKLPSNIVELTLKINANAVLSGETFRKYQMPTMTRNHKLTSFGLSLYSSFTHLPSTLQRLKLEDLGKVNPLNLVLLFKSLPETIHELHLKGNNEKFLWAFGEADSEKKNAALFNQVLENIPPTLYKLNLAEIKTFNKTQLEQIQDKIAQNRKLQYASSSVQFQPKQIIAFDTESQQNFVQRDYLRK